MMWLPDPRRDTDTRMHSPPAARAPSSARLAGASSRPLAHTTIQHSGDVT